MDLQAFAEASSKFAADTEEYVTKINGYIGWLQGLRAQLMTGGQMSAFAMPPRRPPEFSVEPRWVEPQHEATDLTVTGPQAAAS